MEHDVSALNFTTTSIYQPGLLGRGSNARWNEKIFGFFVSSIPVSTVGRAMRIKAEKDMSEKFTQKQEVRRFANSDIFKIVQ